MKEYLNDVLTKFHKVDHFIGWSFFFATLHAMFSPDKRGIFGYLLTFFVSVPIGTLCGMLAQEAGLESYLIYMCVSIASLIAEDVVRFILGVTGFANQNRETIFKKIFQKLTGRKLGDSESYSHSDDTRDN